jgi:hypothetical protein
MCYLLTSAQTEKGSILFGTTTSLTKNLYSDFGNGNSIGITYSYQKSGTSSGNLKSTNISYSPKVGYFLENNFVVGGNYKFSFQSSENSNTFLMGFGPFARLYFGNKKVKPFTEVEAVFSSLKYTYDYNTTTHKSINRLTEISLNGGVALFINKNISIDWIAGYNLSSHKPQDNESEKVSINKLGTAIGCTVTF